MKKISALLCALLLLLPCGCGSTDTTQNLQDQYQQVASANMEAEVTCHLASEELTFSIQCAYDANEGSTTTITAPEELAGLSATISPENLSVSYDEKVWSLGALDTICPANCLPWLLQAAANGYLMEQGTENVDGEECLRMTLDTSDGDDGSVLCTIWFRQSDLTPYYMECTIDGELCLTAKVLSFEWEKRDVDETETDLHETTTDNIG